MIRSHAAGQVARARAFAARARAIALARGRITGWAMGLDGGGSEIADITSAMRVDPSS